MMKKICFGIDVGGTTVKLGLFDNEGNMLENREITTRTEENGCYIIDDIANACEKMIAERGFSWKQVLGAGVGVPGPVTAEGEVLGCVNLGWGHVFLSKLLSEKMHGIQIVVGNDANMAALGEAYYGGGKGCENMIMITLGTGVGGGIIIGGKMLSGANGGAGELGHITVTDEITERCNCGRSGCLEQVASATGIVNTCKRLMKTGTYKSILMDNNIMDAKNQELQTKLTAKDVIDAAKQGDELGLVVLEQLGKYLAMACGHLGCILNPEMIVIGGGVSKAGEILIDSVKKYFADYVFPPCAHVEFRLATLGNKAGMYGGACSILVN